MNYHEWVKEVPKEIADDPLWKTEVYRQALFLGELAWYDACKLAKNRVTLEVADQLFRAVGRISPDIAEGYSRASGKQARFYEYALGSARESRDWYYKARHVLGSAVVEHRLGFLGGIMRQLMKMVPKYRGKTLRETEFEYTPYSDHLQNAPIPVDEIYALRTTHYPSPNESNDV
jgi:four helix bundle protein